MQWQLGTVNYIFKWNNPNSLHHDMFCFMTKAIEAQILQSIRKGNVKNLIQSRIWIRQMLVQKIDFRHRMLQMGNSYFDFPFFIHNASDALQIIILLLEALCIGKLYFFSNLLLEKRSSGGGKQKTLDPYP